MQNKGNGWLFFTFSAQGSSMFCIEAPSNQKWETSLLCRWACICLFLRRFHGKCMDCEMASSNKNWPLLHACRPNEDKNNTECLLATLLEVSAELEISSRCPFAGMTMAAPMTKAHLDFREQGCSVRSTAWKDTQRRTLIDGMLTTISVPSWGNWRGSWIPLSSNFFLSSHFCQRPLLYLYLKESWLRYHVVVPRICQRMMSSHLKQERPRTKWGSKSSHIWIYLSPTMFNKLRVWVWVCRESESESESVYVKHACMYMLRSCAYSLRKQHYWKRLYLE